MALFRCEWSPFDCSGPYPDAFRCVLFHMRTARLFFMLAYGKATGNEEVIRLAGFEGIFCGASAMYGGLAQILNELYGHPVMPLGVHKAV